MGSSWALTRDSSLGGDIPDAARGLRVIGAHRRRTGGPGATPGMRCAMSALRRSGAAAPTMAAPGPAHASTCGRMAAARCPAAACGGDAPVQSPALPGRDHGPGNAGKPGRGPVPGRNARPVPVAGLLTYPRFRKARSAEPDIAFGTRRLPARPPRPRRRGTAAGTLPQPEAQSHSRPLRGRDAAGCAPDHRMPAAARYGRLPG